MTSKGKILAVDDEKALCNILALNLEDAGFEVTQAHSGNEAFKLVREKQFDLIVSDIRMPDGDGIDLLSRVKDNDPLLPVVLFITAFGDITVAEAYNLGAEAFFKKPVDYDQLVAKIEECLQTKPDRWLKKERLDTDLSIDVSFDSYASVSKAHVLNIGQGGFFLKLDNTNSEARVGKILDFKIVFEDGKMSPINGKGVCRWRRDEESPGHPGGVGVEFVEIDDLTHKSLLEVIKSQKTKAFIPIA